MDRQGVAPVLKWLKVKVRNYRGEGTGLGVKLGVDRQPTSRLSSRNTLTTPSGSIYRKHGGRV